MRQVERLVVAAVETGTLGAEVVVGRAQRRGRLRVFDDCSDLLADHLRDDLVGLRNYPLVSEHAEDGEELAGLPRRFEALATNLRRSHGAADLGELLRDATAGPLGRL